MAEEQQRAAQSEQQKEVLTFQEAQQFLRVSHQTLYRLIDEGLPSHKVGKKRMFLRQELLEWVKAH